MALDLNDKTSNGNTLTNVGAVESAVVPFNGNNVSSADLELSDPDYLHAADSASLSPTGDFSIEAYVNLEQLPSTSASDMAIVAKYNLDTNRRSFLLRITQADKLECFISQDGGGSNIVRRISSAAFFVGGDVGNWVHVALTVDISAGAAGVIMYKNASSVGISTTTDAATSVDDNNSRFQIGAYQVDDSTNTNFADMKVDEVRLWGDVRTPTEITDNKDSELTGAEAGLLTYYPFNPLAVAAGVTTLIGGGIIQG